MSMEALELEWLAVEASMRGQSEQRPPELSALTQEIQETYHHIREVPRLRMMGASVLALLSASTLALGIQSRPTSQTCETVTCIALESGLQAPESTISIVPPPRTLRIAAARATPVSPPTSLPKIDVRVPTKTPEKAPPDRAMSYETFRANAHAYLERLPGLEAIARSNPSSLLYIDFLQQTEHILELNQAINITPDDYRNFKIDTSYNTIFKGKPGSSYETQIQPKMFLIHWTGLVNNPYNNDPVLLANGMTRAGLNRVDYYMDRNSKVYQLFESDHNKPGHALPGLNTISQGVEIEAYYTMDFTAGQIKQAIILAVDFCRRNGLPVDESTIVGHYAADTIMLNPYYNPDTGKLKGTIRKSDPPQALMQVIVAKAQALDAVLGPR